MKKYVIGTVGILLGTLSLNSMISPEGLQRLIEDRGRSLVIAYNQADRQLVTEYAHYFDTQAQQEVGIPEAQQCPVHYEDLPTIPQAPCPGGYVPAAKKIIISPQVTSCAGDTPLIGYLHYILLHEASHHRQNITGTLCTSDQTIPEILWFTSDQTLFYTLDRDADINAIRHLQCRRCAQETLDSISYFPADIKEARARTHYLSAEEIKEYLRTTPATGLCAFHTRERELIERLRGDLTTMILATARAVHLPAPTIQFRTEYRPEWCILKFPTIKITCFRKQTPIS